ncbi:MAG TPA: ParB/RepB/Spo0J family partition protein [Nitrososphaeraceae archaeon]|nr:ParB/RepB/Spo0J family partition protein [Nitrososphaeraceae archaeon]
MLRSTQHENELMGSIVDINMIDIFQSPNLLRNSSNSTRELADSIGGIGLLSPILVRIKERRKFEVVAGNRRFKACKLLGWRKMPCYVVELDDRHAFEASIIENIHRNTLNIIEEGLAFRKYVNEFGWGSATELAKKLSKSPSYVSKRMRLLELPEDVLQLICESEMSVSTGEELLTIKDGVKQSEFAKMVLNRSVSSKKLRRVIQAEKSRIDDFDFLYHPSKEEEKENELKAFDKSIITLKMALNNIATMIEKTEDNWIIYEILMNHKNTIHNQIDLLIREKKKYAEEKHFFDLLLLHN